MEDSDQWRLLIIIYVWCLFLISSMLELTPLKNLQLCLSIFHIAWKNIWNRHIQYRIKHYNQSLTPITNNQSVISQVIIKPEYSIIHKAILKIYKKRPSMQIRKPYYLRNVSVKYNFTGKTAEIDSKKISSKFTIIGIFMIRSCMISCATCDL